MIIKNNHKRFMIILCLFLAVNLLFIENKHSYNILLCKDFITALKDKGYRVSEDKVSGDTFSFFSVVPKHIKTGKEIITIYEFKSTKTAKSEAGTISEDGFRIGNSFISWIDKPHFYQKGNLIVSYVGGNKSIIYDLIAIMGNSITK